MNYAYDRKRLHLAQSIAQSGITDSRIIEAITLLPRHLFVPRAYRNKAYEDIPLSIGHGQTISQPSIVALMTQLVKPTRKKNILEIGTGSGYQAALLSLLSKNVYTVERIPSLGQKAREILTRLQYFNVKVIDANGTLGLPLYAPYDGIIVTAGAKAQVPQPLIEQLRSGGRIVVPVGNDLNNQVLIVGIKRNNTLITREVANVRFVPLIGTMGWDVQETNR